VGKRQVRPSSEDLSRASEKRVKLLGDTGGREREGKGEEKARRF